MKITSKNGNLYLRNYGEINFKDYHIQYFNIDCGNKYETYGWNMFPYQRIAYSPPKVDMGNEQLKFTIENLDFISEDDFVNILNTYEAINISLIEADEYEREMEKIRERWFYTRDFSRTELWKIGFYEHDSDYKYYKEKYDKCNNIIAENISKLKSKYIIEESIELEFCGSGKLNKKEIIIRDKK